MVLWMRENRKVEKKNGKKKKNKKRRKEKKKKRRKEKRTAALSLPKTPDKCLDWVPLVVRTFETSEDNRGEWFPFVCRDW